MIKKGFTLIELLVAIALIGILSGFVFVQLNGAINTARDGEKKANLASINKALLMYKTTNGAYPIQTSSCTIGDTCTTLNSALSGTLPTIPSGQTYTYQSNADGSDYTASTVLSTSYSYTYTPSSGYVTNTPAAGVCGSANKAYAYSATTYGSDTFCIGQTSDPESPSFPSQGGSQSWTCPGTYGGDPTSCAASRSGTPSCPSGASCSVVSSDYVIRWPTVGSYSWTVPSGVSSVRYLVVGGGGGSTYYGGGGGAGGYKAGTTAVTAGSALAIEVGAGGTATGTSDIRGTSGGQSKFYNIIADGGGGGGTPYANYGANGGSGGGGGGNWVVSGSVGAGGSATAGNAGGAGGLGDGDHMRGSGGGGGAGAAGAAGSTSSGGAGGIGVVNDITGADVWYAGGGGGGAWGTVGGAGTQATGGGGAGEYYNGGYYYFPSTRNGINGTGGGAGSWVSGSGISVGGSGVVIVRFSIP